MNHFELSDLDDALLDELVTSLRDMPVPDTPMELHLRKLETRLQKTMLLRRTTLIATCGVAIPTIAAILLVYFAVSQPLSEPTKTITSGPNQQMQSTSLIGLVRRSGIVRIQHDTNMSIASESPTANLRSQIEMKLDHQFEAWKRIAIKEARDRCDTIAAFR